MRNLPVASLSFALIAFILWSPHAAFPQTVSQPITPTPEFPIMCQPDIGVPNPYPTTVPPSAVIPPGPANMDLYRVYPSARGIPDLCKMPPQYRTVIPLNPGAPLVPRPVVPNPNTPTAVVPSPNVAPTNAPPGPAYVYPYPYGIGNVTPREYLQQRQVMP
jgi:hypothetical protein